MGHHYNEDTQVTGSTETETERERERELELELNVFHRSQYCSHEGRNYNKVP